MKAKEIFVIVVLFILVIGFTYYYQNFSDGISGDGVCFGNDCFVVEIVDTPESRALGLMNRESLADDAGMLFIFDTEGVYPFWMKDTLISLDIIWINSEKEVVFIAENTETESLASINPGENALYVLEVPGGRAGDVGIEVGSELDFYIS